MIVDGMATLYVDRGGSSLQALPAADDPTVADAALRALGSLIGPGRLREVVISRVDGEPIAASPWRERLLSAGFVPGYRGLALRGAAGASPGGSPAARTH